LRGNVYLRTLLIQGARSTLQSALKAQPSRASRLQRWIIELYGRRGYQKTLVAIANKHARIVWAMLAKDQRYDASAWQHIPWPRLAPRSVTKQRFAAERDERSQTDREQPGYSIGGNSHSADHQRGAARFSTGAREASIVARADRGCPTRPLQRRSLFRLARLQRYQENGEAALAVTPDGAALVKSAVRHAGEVRKRNRRDCEFATAPGAALQKQCPAG
jgi:hypothetical protein